MDAHSTNQGLGNGPHGHVLLPVLGQLVDDLGRPGVGVGEGEGEVVLVLLLVEGEREREHRVAGVLRGAVVVDLRRWQTGPGFLVFVGMKRQRSIQGFFPLFVRVSVLGMVTFGKLIWRARAENWTESVFPFSFFCIFFRN